MRIHTHLHETRAEVEDSKNGKDSMSRHRSEQKTTPLVRLPHESTCAMLTTHARCFSQTNFDRMSLLDDSLICAHMTQLQDSDIKVRLACCCCASV